MRANIKVTVVDVDLKTNEFGLRTFTHEIFPDEFDNVDWFSFYKQIDFFFNDLGIQSYYSCPKYEFTIPHFLFVNEVKKLKSTIQKNVVDIFGFRYYFYLEMVVSND